MVYPVVQEGVEQDDYFDSACCICDNGGDIAVCEGSCMRSFHATREAGKEAAALGGPECVSLGLSEEEVHALPYFECKNCQYKRHQCFSCGQLGSSDLSSGAEVFQCAATHGYFYTCGYFYHPSCVAKLLHQDSEVEARQLEDRIIAGQPFVCPLHICCVCKEPEDRTGPESQMAVCRRCPKAYHEKCLPREISFEDDKDDEGFIPRAWGGLLLDRILIYCLKHDIDPNLGTPARNHIKFPHDEMEIDGYEKETGCSALDKELTQGVAGLKVNY